MVQRHGHGRGGEALETACRRELAEETGLVAARIEPLGLEHSFWVDPAVIPFPDPEPRFNTECCFHAEIRGGEVDLDLEEHETYRWCPPSEALELMRWEGAKAALRLLAARQGWELAGLRPEA